MAAEMRAPSFSTDDDRWPITPFGADLVEYYSPVAPDTPDASICGTNTFDGTDDGDNKSDKVD